MNDKLKNVIQLRINMIGNGKWMVESYSGGGERDRMWDAFNVADLALSITKNIDDESTNANLAQRNLYKDMRKESLRMAAYLGACLDRLEADGI
jgi:hypothetical protein